MAELNVPAQDNPLHLAFSALVAMLPDAKLLVSSSPQDQAAPSLMIERIQTDSRQVRPGDLFVALRGERFDAHDFLAQVAASGASAALVDHLPSGFDASIMASMPLIQVGDTRTGLGQIGRGWRQKLTLPVIAVTGSNGKTTVKEMLSSIALAAYGESGRMATRGNLNNEIGVPLTLLRLNQQHQAAIIEMGMNHPGEIAVLAAIAMPTVALVNNAQREHQEFMISVEAVARENGAVLEALVSGNTAVFPANDPYKTLWKQSVRPGVRTLTFGLEPEGDADVSGTWRAEADGLASRISLTVRAAGLTAQPHAEFILNAAGMHNVRNALAAATCALAAGISMQAVSDGLAAFAPVKGRLQRHLATRPGYAGASVIDDTYNANPDSVLAALDVLAAQPAPRIMVLGDMGEVGDDGEQFHREVGLRARELDIGHVLTLGQLSRYTTAVLQEHGGEHFETIDALLARLDSLAVPAATLLVKGSRFMKMERVVDYLTQMPAVPAVSGSATQKNDHPTVQEFH